MKISAILFLFTAFLECAFCQDEGTCNLDVSTDDRMNRVGANIVNQMGLSEAPENPKVPVFVSESKLAEFHALEQTAGDLTSLDGECATHDVFAREKKAFSPSKAKAIPSNPRYFEKANYLGENDFIRPWRRDSSTSPISHSVPPYIYKLSFNLDLPRGRMFTSADLLLFKRIASPLRRSKLTEFETVQIKLVYDIYYYYYKHLVTEEKEFVVETRIVSTDTDGYVSFNVTDAVKKWLEVNQGPVGVINLEVVIRCPESLSSYKMFPPIIDFDIGRDQFTNSTPKFVVSFVKPEELIDMSSPSSNSGRRIKRQLTRLDGEFCFDNPEEPNCCVRNLTIDFERDFGWTWIMAPKTYDPNYCTGLCPFFWPSISDSTTILQTYRTLNPTSAAEPCCAPDNLKPLVIMFTIQGELYLQLLNNMVVDNCICR